MIFLRHYFKSPYWQKGRVHLLHWQPARSTLLNPLTPPNMKNRGQFVPICHREWRRGRLRCHRLSGLSAKRSLWDCAVHWSDRLPPGLWAEFAVNGVNLYGPKGDHQRTQKQKGARLENLAAPVGERRSWPRSVIRSCFEAAWGAAWNGLCGVYTVRTGSFNRVERWQVFQIALALFIYPTEGGMSELDSWRF